MSFLRYTAFILLALVLVKVSSDRILPAYAQDGVSKPTPTLTDPQASLVEKQREAMKLDLKDAKDKYREFEPFDLEELAFGKDKRGCGRKAGMTIAMLQLYKEGESTDDLTQMKIIEPFIEGVMQKIREKGPEQTVIDNLKEYNTCVDSAEKMDDPEDEMNIALKSSSCKEMNLMLLDVLDSIKKRRKSATVLDKYQRSPPDLQWTPFGSVPDPAIFIVGQLYEEANEKSYEDAVQLAGGFSAVCY